VSWGTSHSFSLIGTNPTPFFLCQRRDRHYYNTDK